MLFAGSAAGADADDMPPQELLGSYWGTMEVFGKSYDMCLVIEKNSVAIHSDKRGRSYPLIKYTDKKDGTWLVSCYNAKENKKKPVPRMTVTINRKSRVLQSVDTFYVGCGIYEISRLPKR